jgi:hypothetical protein
MHLEFLFDIFVKFVFPEVVAAHLITKIFANYVFYGKLCSRYVR